MWVFLKRASQQCSWQIWFTGENKLKMRQFLAVIQTIEAIVSNHIPPHYRPLHIWTVSRRRCETSCWLGWSLTCHQQNSTASRRNASDTGRLWVRNTHGMADASAGVLLLVTITCCLVLDAGTPCPALKSRGAIPRHMSTHIRGTLKRNVRCFKEIQGKNVQIQ